MSRDEKSMKNIKMKLQNEKIIETNMDICHQTYGKTVIRVRKKQCNVYNHMICLRFAFKDSKYARNIVFLLVFWNIKKVE